MMPTPLEIERVSALPIRLLKRRLLRKSIDQNFGLSSTRGRTIGYRRDPLS